jgi:hypothetical protein
MIVATRLSSPKSRQFIAWKEQKREPYRRVWCEGCLLPDLRLAAGGLVKPKPIQRGNPPRGNASYRPCGDCRAYPEGIIGLSLGGNPRDTPAPGPALKGQKKICYRWFVRSTSTVEAIILPPLQGGTPILSVPGVKTPGLVLLSLRDMPDTSLRNGFHSCADSRQ